jgi:hypothetical protein
MHKIKLKPILSTIALAALAACGGGGGGSQPAAVTVQQTADGYQIQRGLAQKGPLSRGSIVTINELTLQLAPNGKSYTFETVDDYGTFKPSSVFGSPYLETTVQGYFFNELTNERNKDWVVLRGLSNLAVGADRTVNVNVLSAFTNDRIRVLIAANPSMGFNAARQQAQRELLSAFYIYNSTDILSGNSSTGAINPANFLELDLSQARLADQILATISGMIVYTGQNGGGVNALISSVATDLADDGLLNNSTKFVTSVLSQFNTAATKTPFGLIARNLNTYYALKTPYGQNDLAQWVDSSGGVDQVIDKYKFTLIDASAGIESLSPDYAAGTDDVGQCISATAGSTLYKNGALQAGSVVAAAGDRFALGITPYASQTSSAFMLRSAPVNGVCPSTAAPTSPRLVKYSVTGAISAADLAVMPASYLGANLPGVYDWVPTPVFADLMHQARQFGPPDHPWGGPTDTTTLGADGWPTGDFGIFLMAGNWLSGTYKVSFNGTAKMGTNGSPDVTIANQVYDPVKNLTTADVIRGPAAGNMALTFTNTGTGIKNLKVVRPGYDPLNPPLFTNEFLNHIARFKTLRFMEWLLANGNPSTTWDTRAKPETHYRTSAGVPWEHIIALANQTGKDIWINIPALVDDNYVLQLATLLKATLNSNIKVYVEYSNEVWNGSFQQATDNRNLATAEVSSNPSSPLVYDGTTDPYTMAFRRTAKRLKEISDTFRTVYGDAAMMTQIRPILAGQVVNRYILSTGLEMIDAVYGPPSRYFYAIAGAPYFNMGSQQQVDGLTPDAVLSALDASVTSMPKEAQFEQNIALSRWYNLPFYSYEAGPDTFGTGSIAAKKAANLDPRMLDLCKKYLSSWYSNGGETMMWYTAGAGTWDTQYGTYSLTYDLSVETPKTQCMDQVLASPLPVLTGRNKVPGTINALAYVGSNEPYTTAAANATHYLHPGSYIDYVLLAPASGNYTLTLNTESSKAGNQVDVSVNGKLTAPLFELNNTGANTPADNVPIALSLNKGFNTVRIRTRAETSGFILWSLTVR